jgi:hypothetical protein
VEFLIQHFALLVIVTMVKGLNSSDESIHDLLTCEYRIIICSCNKDSINMLPSAMDCPAYPSSCYRWSLRFRKTKLICSFAFTIYPYRKAMDGLISLSTMRSTLTNGSNTLKQSLTPFQKLGLVNADVARIPLLFFLMWLEFKNLSHSSHWVIVLSCNLFSYKLCKVRKLEANLVTLGLTISLLFVISSSKPRYCDVNRWRLSLT